MAEYIDKAEAIRALTSSADYIADALERLDNIPAADVQTVKHGKWLSKEYMYGDPDVGIEDMWIDRLAEQSDYYAYCSICGKDAGYTAEGSLILSNYCSNCGAMLEGVSDG